MAAAAVDQAAARMEVLLAGFGDALGADAEAYGNHVRRVFGLVVAQSSALSPDELEVTAIAAVFHDIAIWLDGTFDYLSPSRQHAADYLREQGRGRWEPIVSALVMEHHRIRPIKHTPLAEAFRRADLCDLTFGRARRGIPAGTWKALAAAHPPAGFHLRLVQFTAARAAKHPLSPLPMLRW